MTFLVSFENEMDLNEFTEICKESGDTWIVHKDITTKDDGDNDDSSDENPTNNLLERKVVIQHHVKHIPLFICKNMPSHKCNLLLKHHIQNLINFVNVRTIDHDELMDHDTTTWFSQRESYTVKSYQVLKELFQKELKESHPNFMHLLPIKVIVRISNLTYRCYDRLLNGAHRHLNKNEYIAKSLNRYVRLLRALRRCKGKQQLKSYITFQSRKITLNKCKGDITINDIINHLFQKKQP